MLPPNLHVIDFESTGVDAKTAHPVEVAVVGYIEAYMVQLIKSPIPIPHEASAVHHIIDADLEGQPTWEEVLLKLRDHVTFAGYPILVAHNAAYEQDILKGEIEARWICTYKCALVQWPDAPSHKNEVLRYWLGLSRLGRGYPQQAHSALHDCIVTREILLELLKYKTLEQLIEISSKPAQLPYVPFGKHFKQKWSEIPISYLDWILKQADMREDVKACAATEILRRHPKPK